MSLIFLLKGFLSLLYTGVYLSNNVRGLLMHFLLYLKGEFQLNCLGGQVCRTVVDLHLLLQNLDKLDLPLQLDQLIMEGWVITLHIFRFSLASVSLLVIITYNQDIPLLAVARENKEAAW